MSSGRAVASGNPAELTLTHAGREAHEVFGPPARLAEVEEQARARGLSTRRTGTSVAILHANRPPICLRASGAPPPLRMRSSRSPARRSNERRASRPLPTL